MNVFYPVAPKHIRTFDTPTLRSTFLVDTLFSEGRIAGAYSLEDRLILLGAVPTVKPLSAEIAAEVTGTDQLLDRREIGIINIGGPGSVESGKERFSLPRLHCLYLGRESGTPRFASDDPDAPARFYAVSVPAHRRFDSATVGPDEVEPLVLGDTENANRRALYKYIHPDGIKSSQLVMGFTELEPGSVWNTMPPHTHLRRTEAYLYFGLPRDQAVMHFMGEGEHTRHLVVRDAEAVLSPSWSIHAGAGTSSYSFVWAMAGENQAFTDMDHIAVSQLH